MYKGYKIDLLTFEENEEYYYLTGLKIFNDAKVIIEKSLDKYISVNGKLNGDQMQKDWFPEVDADIFISHSHNDERFAIAFAGWLYTELNIATFVDSCIWGYADDLLRIIDNKYCYQKDFNTYSYATRNLSTSYVHMMLSVAISKMMDKAECLFFLNSNNAISSQDIETKTVSPWLYAELAFSNYIRKKIPDRLKHVVRDFDRNIKNEVLNADLKMELSVNIENLQPINFHILNNWHNWSTTMCYKSPQDALDKLYELTR